MKIDKPETWLAIHGYLIAFAWEMLQMPFYDMGGLSPWQVTVNCSLASFGDAGIMVFAYLAASWAAKDRYWLHSGNRRSLAVFLAAGQAVTLAVEYVALRVRWGWEYSDRMPTILGFGLVPIVMWIVVPLAALGLARRSSRKLVQQ